MDVGHPLVVRSNHHHTQRYMPYQRVHSQFQAAQPRSQVKIYKVNPRNVFEDDQSFYCDPPRPMNGFYPSTASSLNGHSGNFPHLAEKPVSVSHSTECIARVKADISVDIPVGTAYHSQRKLHYAALNDSEI